jgi:hypothetical protein
MDAKYSNMYTEIWRKKRILGGKGIDQKRTGILKEKCQKVSLKKGYGWSAGTVL